LLNKFQIFGRKNESVAARYLKKNGYRIITKNYRTKMGEIDIIAKEGDVIVFVEVKARKSPFLNRAKESVTKSKQHKLTLTAYSYLKQKGLDGKSARFDVVSIDYTQNLPEIEVIKNAFEATI